MRRIILTAACVLAFGIGANAETFSLTDAIKAGLENGLGIKAAGLSADAAKETVQTYRAEFDPYVSASAGVEDYKDPNSYSVYDTDFRTKRDFTGGISITKKHEAGFTAEVSADSARLRNNDEREELNPAYRTGVEFRLSFPLLKNYGRDTGTAGIRTAENTSAAYGLDYFASALDTAYSAETAYYAYQRALGVLAYREESGRLAAKLLEANRKKLESGVIPVTEVQEAETALASRDEQIIAARQEVRRTKNILENIINADLANGAEIPALRGMDDGLPVSAVFLEHAREKRPDMLKQKLALASSDIKIQYLRNQELPELDFKGSLGINGLSGHEASENRFDGSYLGSLPYASDSGGYSWYAGVNFRYPLGNRAARAESAAAGSEKLRELIIMKKLDADTVTEIRNAFVLIEGSRERHGVAGRFRALAEKSLAQETRRMEEGLSDTFRILDFQDDVIEAKIRELDALYDYNTGLAKLYRASGENLSRYGIAFRYSDGKVM
ncbi:TolC family protein [Geovibrio thiophilus]|uniref:TolC family protein n=1 Tax=Geovibrio thiophilus TaxID=139438 RepID=A0A3R5XWA0_9BACT|nr:TolC family protein [Geovibrio thiophilus]QAR32198.1 TolC family protein [Geovibrio thiophilus]